MCYNKGMNDEKIYRKAGGRVKASLVLFFILYALLVFGTWFLLHIDLFATGSEAFSQQLLMISACQLIGFFFVFLFLASGRKAARILYLFAALLNFALIWYPTSGYLENPGPIYTWIAWAACLIIQDVLLYNVFTYLFNNGSCRVFYDHTLQLTEEEYEEMMNQPEEEEPVAMPEKYRYTGPAPQPAAKPVQPRTQQARENLAADWPVKPVTPNKVTPPPAPDSRRRRGNVIRRALSLKTRMQRAAIYLGAAVYGEMFIFPVIVSNFKDFFASTDMKSVFATRDIFILCMASALIWTVAILFLYYASAKSKKVILGCWVAELVVNAWYIPRFIGYYTSGTPAYPLQVFIFFAILDLIRYAFIIMALYPLKDAWVKEKKTGSSADAS